MTASILLMEQYFDAQRRVAGLYPYNTPTGGNPEVLSWPEDHYVPPNPLAVIAIIVVCVALGLGVFTLGMLAGAT